MVTVEAHLSGGLPAFQIVGLPETSVKESKDRVRSALINSGFKFPDCRIYLTKQLLNFDVSSLAERRDLMTLMTKLYVDDKPRKISNLASQVWTFGHLMQVYDLVVLPSKFAPEIYIGVIGSGYQFNESLNESLSGPYNHWRDV